MKVAAAFLSNALFNFVIGLLLARYLGPEEYGRFALAIAVAVLVQTVFFDWARLAAVRFYSERVRTDDPRLRATLDASLALLIAGLAVVTAALVLRGPIMPIAPGLAGLAVAVAIANGLFDFSAALVRARFLDGLYVRLIMAKNGLSLVLTIGGAFWFGSSRAALLGVVLSMAGTLACMRHGLSDPEAHLVRADRRLAGTLARYAMPVVLANLFYQTIPFVDRLIIARQFGLAESGQFSLAYDIGVRIVAAVGSMLDVLLFQIAVRADETGGAEQGRRQVGRNLGLVIAILAPSCAGIWLVLPSFELLVIPADFRGPFRGYLAALLPGLFCYGLIFFALNPLFQLDKATGPLIAVAIGASGINLVGLALLPPGTQGFAIAQGMAFAVAVAALLAWAAARRPFWPRGLDLLGAAAGTALMTVAGWAIGSSMRPGAGTLGVQIATGFAVYGAFAAAIDLCGLRSAARAWLRGRRPS